MLITCFRQEKAYRQQRLFEMLHVPEEFDLRKTVSFPLRKLCPVEKELLFLFALAIFWRLETSESEKRLFLGISGFLCCLKLFSNSSYRFNNLLINVPTFFILILYLSDLIIGSFAKSDT